MNFFKLLIGLISIALLVVAVIVVPYSVFFAFLGFSGRLADAGWDINLQGGFFFLGIAVATVIVNVVWFRHAFARMRETP